MHVDERVYVYYQNAVLSSLGGAERAHPQCRRRVCTFGVWKAPNVHITRADVLICALNVATRRMCELAVSRGHTRCERSVLGVDHDRVVCSLGLQLVRELFQEQFAVLDSLA